MTEENKVALEAAEATSEETHLTFDSFGFKPEIKQGIDEAGFSEPTPIQLKAIPVIMEGKDLIGQALTGTGKTAAFGLPIMDKMVGKKGLSFLVLVPTRELAAQVSAELYRLGHCAGIHTAAFTGGQSYSRQEKMLSMGVDALVATPGRLIDLIESGHFKDINPEYIVVDEADEMLDMGFIDDVKRIFEAFPGPRQTMLFSATMPRPVVELADTILKEPVNITTSFNETANNDIEQFFFVIEDSERTNAIIRLIDAQDVTKAMIFCRTKEETDALNILLGGRGYNVNCLHGDMEQAQRSRVMGAFRRGEIDILVATDVAARGLDVDDVTHVFNFHLPFDSRGYVHRIGRTGRAGKTGTAITLVTPRELRQLEAIKRTVGAQIENRLIPTRTEVTSMRLKKIFHDMHDYELDMGILRQVQTLTVNQDVMVLLAKLVAHELAGGADQGPEQIGINGKRLDDLLSSKPRRGRGERGERGERRERTRRSSRSERGERSERVNQEEVIAEQTEHDAKRVHQREDVAEKPVVERRETKKREERRERKSRYDRTPPEETSIYELPVEKRPKSKERSIDDLVNEAAYPVNHKRRRVEQDAQEGNWEKSHSSRRRSERPDLPLPGYQSRNLRTDLGKPARHSKSEKSEKTSKPEKRRSKDSFEKPDRRSNGKSNGKSWYLF